MKAHEMTFGVEIECYMPVGNVVVGSWGNPSGGNLWLPAGWMVKPDGSLTAAPAGMRGVEIISPSGDLLLRGESGFDQVVAVVAAIKQRGGVVNVTCGLHVHVGFDKNNYNILQHLVALIANHEKAIYASTGTKSRERGTYSKPIKHYGGNTAAVRRASRDRYHVLNLATTKPTVEFRAFAGTLNIDKVLGAIGICLGLVEKAYDQATTGRRVNWNQRVNCTQANEGQVELERLFRRLGWIGRVAVGTGMLRVSCTDRQEVIKKVVKTLRRLAVQYDAQA
jgi:hypothetical protein